MRQNARRSRENHDEQKRENLRERGLQGTSEQKQKTESRRQRELREQDERRKSCPAREHSNDESGRTMWPPQVRGCAT
jgi:hypothetical protein